MNQRIGARAGHALLGCICVAVVSCRAMPADHGSGEQSIAGKPESNLAQPGLIKSEFIFETAPFPECHASTIVETESGLVAAWFGGTRERHPDVGIWLSRLTDGKWTAPVE